MVETARFPGETLSNTGDTENLGEMVVEPAEVQGSPREINGDLRMYRKIEGNTRRTVGDEGRSEGETKRFREIFY
jgi:hypothetical protein